MAGRIEKAIRLLNKAGWRLHIVQSYSDPGAASFWSVSAHRLKYGSMVYEVGTGYSLMDALRSCQRECEKPKSAISTRKLAETVDVPMRKRIPAAYKRRWKDRRRRERLLKEGLFG